jgi:hypothetical protein
MDKHGFGAIGAIICMVIAGLIVYGIIYYGPSILHGNQGGSGGSGTGTFSPSYVRTHASLYLENEIIVEGYWMEYVMSAGVMSGDLLTLAAVPAESLAGLLGTYGGSGLISGGKYRITGTLKTVPYPSSNLGFSGLKLVFGISVYLDVTSVEPM